MWHPNCNFSQKQLFHHDTKIFSSSLPFFVSAHFSVNVSSYFWGLMPHPDKCQSPTSRACLTSSEKVLRCTWWYFMNSMNAFTIFQSCIIWLPNVWTVLQKLHNYTALKPTSLDKWLNCQRRTMRQMCERMTDVMYRLPWHPYSVCLLYNCSDLHLIGWENIRRDVGFFNIALSTRDIIQH